MKPRLLFALLALVSAAFAAEIKTPAAGRFLYVAVPGIRNYLEYGGHGVLVYHYGKQTALALWGSGPGFAMDANMLLSWHRYGGGKELLAKLYESVGANVVSFPYGPMPTQPPRCRTPAASVRCARCPRARIG